jgi:hypothetical protein
MILKVEAGSVSQGNHDHRRELVPFSFQTT